LWALSGVTCYEVPAENGVREYRCTVPTTELFRLIIAHS
jgi:hypothetical protein